MKFKLKFKGLRFAHAEMAHASAGTIMKLVMVAISVIPLLYGGLYLTAFLDPYENLDTVPVAVVNEDQGAKVNDEWRVVGDDVVEKLADNHDGLGWEFVSADEAKSGLETGRYYMTCTIPANFTETIASADSDAPEKAALVIDYNQTQNMLASQIGGSVWKEVRTQVSDTVAEEYWNTVFDKINDGGDQIQTAADGAGELKDGLEEAHDGSSTITDNLGTLADGANTLSSGSDRLQQEGTQALADGASKLAEQTSALPDATTVKSAQEGAEAISDGFDGLKGGLAKLKGSTKSGEGLAYAAASAHQLSSGLSDTSKLDGGIAQLQAGVTAVKGGLKDDPSKSVDAALAAALQYLEAGDTAHAKAYIQAAQKGIGSKTDTSSATLYGGLNQLSAGLSSLQTTADKSLATASAGAGKLADGLDTAVSAIGSSSDTSTKTLYGGVNNLSSGYESFSSQLLPLVESAPKLKTAINKISAGAKTVNEKMGEVSSGSAKIADGATKLRDGSQELTDGLATAEDGAGELADGLADGASELHVDGADAKAEVMSAPVELQEEYFTTVKNYGTGFAPYFISLGLWVGALMAGFVLRPLNRRLVLSGGNPAMCAFSSFMPLAAMSIVQALLLLAALQFGLQLQIDNVAGYYAFGILTALVFAAFMQFLMAAFGFPGKFIAIILLMLQLTSAAGTFPIEQTPAFFQAMNPFMPMTYVVAGMRQIMTGVDYNTVALCVAVLTGLGIASFALTAAVARAKRTVRMEDLHPILQLG